MNTTMFDVAMTEVSSEKSLTPNRPYKEMAAHPCLAKDRSSFSFEHYVSYVGTRSAHINEYGFVLVTEETGIALATLLKNKKCLDAGAGTGWLSYILTQHGVDMIASDTHVEGNDYGFKKVWQNNHNGCSVDLLPGAFDAVVLAWPPYDYNFGRRVLDAMTEGQLLIYQGEGRGGCTGDDDMHEQLHDDTVWSYHKEDSQRLNQHHLQFDGIHDRWYVYTKLK